MVINFQRYDVKEMVLSKAWAMKPPVMQGDTRIYFDNDYSKHVLKLRRTYAKIKEVLLSKKIKFNTPYTKIRIHWEEGKIVYNNAEAAAREMRKRGLDLGDAEPTENETGGAAGGDTAEGDGSAGGNGEATPSSLLQRLQTAGLSAWKRVEKKGHRTTETGIRARRKLRPYKR